MKSSQIPAEPLEQISPYRNTGSRQPGDPPRNARIRPITREALVVVAIEPDPVCIALEEEAGMLDRPIVKQ